MPVELPGVAVEAEAGAALLVALEKPPAVVSVTGGILLKFVAETLVPSFDTVVTFDDKMVPSVELGVVLFGRLLISVLFLTCGLALAAVGEAWLMVGGFVVIGADRPDLSAAGCTADRSLLVVELYPLFVLFVFVTSVLLLLPCSFTSRKIKIIPQEGCMVLTSEFVLLYTEPARNSLLPVTLFCKPKLIS